jgi:hypothetical protein
VPLPTSLVLYAADCPADDLLNCWAPEGDGAAHVSISSLLGIILRLVLRVPLTDIILSWHSMVYLLAGSLA